MGHATLPRKKRKKHEKHSPQTLHRRPRTTDVPFPARLERSRTMAATRGRKSPAEFVDRSTQTFCCPAQVGGRNAGALGRSHLRLQPEGCHHLRRHRITGEALRKNHPAVSAERVGPP